MINEKSVREPLFHITKRTEVSLFRQIIVRVIAILLGFLVASVIFWAIYGTNPITVITEIFSYNLGQSYNRWTLLRDTALLLGVGLALIPAFKMKFWNLGGNGQILVGALATMVCMYYLGGKLPDAVVWIFMILTSVLAGAIWALIPALFKAFFNTNETLFTLMMNYIAVGLVLFFVKEWCGPKKTKLAPMTNARFPILGNEFLLIILVSLIICAIIYIYMKHSKQGFELSIVGDSENTARYVGMNVKKVIIRTLIISGALCGIIGCLIVGAKDYNISEDAAKNMGFTAIIAVWLAKMNPLATIGTSFGIVFITNGMSGVQTVAHVTDSSMTEIIVGLIYLFIIGCEFFISYSVKIHKKNKRNKEIQSTLERGDN